MDLETVVGKISERKIQEAIEEGQFDNLPGKGKPIVFDEDLMTPPEMRLANRILKNANVLPEWIQMQKDLEQEQREVVGLRARLIRECQQAHARLETLPATHPHVRHFGEWHAKSRASYLRHLKNFNTGILKFSLTAPKTIPAPIPYRLEQEMATFDAEFRPLPQQAPTPVGEEAPTESPLKTVARTQYQSQKG